MHLLNSAHLLRDDILNYVVLPCTTRQLSETRDKAGVILFYAFNNIANIILSIIILVNKIFIVYGKYLCYY